MLPGARAQRSWRSRSPSASRRSRCTAGDAAIPLDALGLGGLMLKEILVGIAFSFVLGALFAAVSAPPARCSTRSIGFSFGSLVDPMTGNAVVGALAALRAWSASLVFIAINGDAWVIQGLARTYDAVPLLDAPQHRLAGGGRRRSRSPASSSRRSRSPRRCCSRCIITDAAFGVVSRVVPQLNVFAVGFPAKVAVGLAADRRLAAVRRRLDRRRAAALGRPPPSTRCGSA